QFGVADLAGGNWGERARDAAIKIEGGSDTTTINTRALADARAIFYPTDDEGRTLDRLECISSGALAERLAENPDGPWREWKNGKALTQVQLARLLKPFGIKPDVIRPPGSETTIRGYQRAWFEDAWERYL